MVELNIREYRYLGAALGSYTAAAVVVILVSWDFASLLLAFSVASVLLVAYAVLDEIR